LERGGQGFYPEVPELAGCMADGETYQKPLANGKVIIQEWVETAQELGRGKMDYLLLR
jgi:predicted RNase H-like HicB family nuclease